MFPTVMVISMLMSARGVLNVIERISDNTTDSN